MEYTKSVEAKVLHKALKNGPRIVVLGIGNLLLKDDGVGIHVVQRLVDTDIGRGNIDIIDGGTYPDVLSLVDDGIDKLIVVDAAKAGSEPGSVYRFDLDDLDLESAVPISLHEIGVLNNLKIMASLDRQPKSTVVIGVEPKTIDFGLELSPEVEAKIPEIVQLVLKEIEETIVSV